MAGPLTGAALTARASAYSGVPSTAAPSAESLDDDAPIEASWPCCAPPSVSVSIDAGHSNAGLPRCCGAVTTSRVAARCARSAHGNESPAVSARVSGFGCRSPCSHSGACALCGDPSFVPCAGGWDASSRPAGTDPSSSRADRKSSSCYRRVCPDAGTNTSDSNSGRSTGARNSCDAMCGDDGYATRYGMPS